MWRKALAIGVATLAFSIYAHDWGIGVQPDFGVRIEAICILDDGLTGWVTGFNHVAPDTLPVILHTSDGGNTWTRLLNIPRTATDNMNGLHFLCENKGWAVGDRGVILYTENGGTSWAEQTSGVTRRLRDVFFVDSMTGWIVGDGGTILNTVDGGATWNAQTSGTGERLNAIAVYDTLRLWIAGNAGTILYTTDGGNTWTRAADVPVAERFLLDIDFVDTLRGWAVGYGSAFTGEPSYIVKTEDGGITWTLLTQTDPTYHNLWAIDMISETEGYIVGSSGVILKTTDGNNFNIIPQTTTINMLKDLAVVDGKIWAAGEHNCILFSADEVTWEYQISLLSPSLNSIGFFAHNNIWMVGWKGMVTVYNGTEWFSKTLFTTDGKSNTLRGIDVVNPNTAWVIGSGGFVAKTTDGGGSWIYQESGVTSTLRGIFALNESKAWAWGSDGTIIRCDDGTTWTTLTTPVTTTIRGGFFFDENNGWIVGSDGLKAKIIGGDSLIDLTDTLLTDETLSSILFVSPSKGWIAGDNGTILYTEDGGANWTTQESGLTTEDLRTIEFINETTGWIVGTRGVILHTSNAGTVWTRVGKGLLDGTITDVTFFADGFGFACGVWGTGLQYGIYGIEEMIPNRNISHSLYPNPAKGTVRIKFTLPSSQKVRLDIYNIVGQRIRAIEEYSSSGDNVLIWDGKDETGKFLPGGVYFYRINSPDLRETGKFVFLR